MKLNIVKNKKALEVSSTLAGWIFAIIILLVLLGIIYLLKAKQFSVLDKLREMLLFR